MTNMMEVLDWNKDRDDGKIVRRRSGDGLLKRVTFDLEATYYGGGGQIVTESGEERTLPPQVIIACNGHTLGVMKRAGVVEMEANGYTCMGSEILELAMAVWRQHHLEPESV